jgi:hypothetical protein
MSEKNKHFGTMINSVYFTTSQYRERSGGISLSPDAKVYIYSSNKEKWVPVGNRFWSWDNISGIDVNYSFTNEQLKELMSSA